MNFRAKHTYSARCCKVSRLVQVRYGNRGANWQTKNCELSCVPLESQPRNHSTFFFGQLEVRVNNTYIEDQFLWVSYALSPFAAWNERL